MSKTRNCKPEIEDHHILAKSRKGKRLNNIKKVPSNFHSAYHTVFENLTPDEAFQYLQEIWFDPHTKFVSPAIWLANSY